LKGFAEIVAKSRESTHAAYDEKMLPKKTCRILLAFLVSGGAGGAK